MRRLTILLGLVLAAALAVGCDRGEKYEEPKVYDPTIDSPPSTLVVEPDPQLLANQAEIAKKSPKRIASAAGVPQAGGEPLESIKKTVLAFVDALEARQVDKITGFFVAQDAQAIKPGLVALFALQEKLAKLDQLIKTQFGPEIPDNVFQTTLAQIGLIIANPDKFDRPAILEALNKAQVTTAGDRVTLTIANAQTFTFLNVNGSWKIELNPELRQSIGIISETVAGIHKVTDSISSGINDGTITKDNLVPKIREQGQAAVETLMAKIKASVPTPTTPGATTPEGTAATPPEGTVAKKKEKTKAPPGGTVAAPAGTVGAPTVAPVEPNAPAAAPPPVAPAPEEDINRGRGPEKAEEMKRHLMAPATRLYGGSS